MPQIENADEARGVARLIQSGQLTGASRDTAMTALREFDTRQTAAAPAEDNRSLLRRMIEEFQPANAKRAAGLTARTLVEGATDLPVALGDVIVSGANKVLPDNAQLASISASRDYTLRGLPQPQGGLEEGTAAIGRGISGALTGSGLASQIAKVASALGTTQKVARVVADAPGLAAVSGGTGAASSDIARQAGASPGVQLAAGIAGGLAPSARQLTAAALRARPVSAAKAATNEAAAEKDEAVRILLKNNIPLTAEQRGVKLIGHAARGVDSVVGKSEFHIRQQRAFNAAVLSKAGSEGGAATDGVMKDLRQRLNLEFDDLSNTVPTKLDEKLQTALREIGEEAANELDSNSEIAKQIRRLTERGSSGHIDGRTAQNARSALGRLQGSQNPSVKHFASQIRKQLDAALERSASPANAKRVRTVIDQYRIMKQIENAVAGNAEGNISATKLYNGMSQKKFGGREQVVYGQGDQSLVDLARAGKQLLREPVGDSGTASRVGPILGGIAGATGAIAHLPATLAVGTGMAAARIGNEIQPVAKLLGGTGVRTPSQTVSEAAAQAKGALPSAGMVQFAEERRRRRRKMRAAAMRRAPGPFR